MRRKRLLIAAAAVMIACGSFIVGWAVYAPRHRQANLTALTSPSADRARALDLAGSDAVAAFRYDLDRAPLNPGVPR